MTERQSPVLEIVIYNQSDRAKAGTSMSQSRILDPAESYTFSKFAELPFDASDILGELGVTLKNIALQLPHQLPIDPNPLRLELQENLTLVSPSSEIARRESLIFPVLKTVCRTLNVPLKLNIQFELAIGSKARSIT